MKILKAKQVGSNFTVVVENAEGQQQTMTRKKTSFKTPEEFEKLKSLVTKLEASKNKETKAAIKIVTDIVKIMTPETTKAKEQLEDLKGKQKTEKKVAVKKLKSTKAASTEVAVASRNLSSVIDDIKLLLENEATSEEDKEKGKAMLKSLEEKTNQVNNALPAASTAQVRRSGEY